MRKEVNLRRLLISVFLISLFIPSVVAFGENLTYNRYGFSAAFDSGRLGTIRPAGYGVYNLSLQISPLGKHHSAWLNFFIKNSKRSITINIKNVNGIGEFTSSPATRFVYSCDGINWQRITNASRCGSTFTFQKKFPCSPVEVATYFPYPFSAIEQYLDNVSMSPYANVTTLGPSVQGRPIRMIELTNQSINESEKKQVFMIGRQHSGETSSTFIFQGLIEYVLSNTSVLDKFHFYIVPAANPDGIYLGNTREQSQGLDMNRGWDNTKVQETNVVREALGRVNAERHVDFFVDNHGYAGGESTSVVYYCGSNGSKLYGIFRDLSAFSSGSNTYADPAIARGHACNTLGIDPVFLMESGQHNSQWTIKYYKDQGRHLVRAIDRFYYPLGTAPALPENETLTN
jgi:hypothetical protein